MDKDLFSKYDVPSPRYTSYPTVVDWQTDSFTPAEWRSRLTRNLTRVQQDRSGADVYVHLPFCESLCTFCGCTKRITRNHDVETPYIKAVLAEMTLHAKHFGGPLPVRSIHLGGGTPTFFSADNLRGLIDGLKSLCDTGGREPTMSLEAHPGVTTEEQLAELGQLGFRRLSLGIQDFDPLVQRAIHREVSEAVVEDVITKARAQGFTSISVDLVYGLPKQTPASIQRTVSAILRWQPDRIAYYGYAHVPWIGGTGQRGFSSADIPGGYQKRSLYDFARALLMEAGYVELGLDHFARPGDELALCAKEHRLSRNFMGYIPDRASVTLGLGVSAISDCGDAFSQNIKAVEQYQERTGAGELPIEKGHLMSPTDRVIGKRIEEVMCNMQTSLDGSDAGAGCMPAVKQRLSALAADGLITIEGGEVHVTEQGRPFLRNICMAFDQYRGCAEPSAGRFSQAL